MKTAVVTGTSTGIGLTTSLYLARHGYRVFAGMRNTAKAGGLREAAAAEDWIRLGADLSDTEYNARFTEYFGIEL